MVQKVTSLSARLYLPKHMGHCTSLRMSTKFTGINLQVSVHDVNSPKWLEEQRENKYPEINYIK